jgi:predicted MFS family arabinose efflux permease
VRRLFALISALLFLEMLFLAGLSPLLPELEAEFGLSTSQAGVLWASYALGAMVGAMPAAVLAARRGPRGAALISLTAFAAASIAFGVAATYGGLLAARLAQGAAGAVLWMAGMVWVLEVAPPERRGEVLGLALGVAEAGAIAGPVVGGIAAATGRAGTFVGIAVVCLLLALATMRFPAPPHDGTEPLLLRRMLSSSRVRIAIRLTMLPACLLAAVSVLAPLQQSALGAGAGEIAATFAVAALAGILIRPLYGRWSDRRGPVRPIAIGLLANVPLVIALPWLDSRWAVALTVCAVLVLIGVLWAPLMVMLSDACVAVGVGQIMAVAVMSLVWPPGNVLGSAGGAAIAEATSQRFAYALIGLALFGGFLALQKMNGARTGEWSGRRVLAGGRSVDPDQPFDHQRTSGRSLE